MPFGQTSNVSVSSPIYDVTINLEDVSLVEGMRVIDFWPNDN
jgi:hypothetical protein